MTTAVDINAGNARYSFVRRLGAGGMGTVWQGRDELLQRDVALKSLRDERDLGQLQQEARALAALRHPNIVTVHDLVVLHGQPYLVMDLVDGPSLAELLQEVRVLEEPELRRTGVQLADALAYAHQRGVCHNDVKPANIIFDRNRNPHLTDFGVAHLSGTTTSLSGAEAVFGTLAYMAPESLTGAPPSSAADVYSLGATLFECMAARPPFVGGASSVAQRLIQPAPPLRTFAPDASEALESILAKALALSPSDRFRSAGEFADALLANPEDNTTRQLVAWPPGGTPSVHDQRRRTAIAVGTAVLGLVLVAAAGTLWWSGDEQPSARNTVTTPVAGAAVEAVPTATATAANSAVAVAPSAAPRSSSTAQVPQGPHPVVIKSHGKPDRPGKHD